MLGLVAIALVGLQPRPELRPAGVPEALLASLCFGWVFVLLRAADSQTAALWELVPFRVGAVVVLGCLLLPGLRSVGRIRPTVWSLPVIAGLFDSAGNAAYVLTTGRSLLGLAAILACLYPAVTVVWARVILGERLSRAQSLGAICAVTAVVAIGTGAA